MMNPQDSIAANKANALLSRTQKLHFVGIGGSGMNGIAEVMHNLGYQVSGSDISRNKAVQRLEALGVTITIGHQAESVHGVDAVVVSTAIGLENPEVAEAKKCRIPVVPRAQMLSELMRFRFGIAVAGTHGKTTTTSLVTSLLTEGKLDPTFVIGGVLNSAGSSAQLGDSAYLVAEADESDASFLFLQPMMAVVTNIDQDHMQTYDGDFNKLKQAFIEFLHHLPFYGLAIVCLDDPGVQSVVDQVNRSLFTYGFSPAADLVASDVRADKGRCQFRVVCPSYSIDAQLSLNMPGAHNVSNALAAIAVALQLGVEWSAIESGLSQFQGVRRRLQRMAEHQTPVGNVLQYDDYGHHPSELAVTLDAVTRAWPERRVVLVFQPHRYSRTRDLFDDFVDVLSGVACLLVTEVFAAGETAITAADGKSLCRAIRSRGKTDPIYISGPDKLAQVLPGLLQDGDLLLTCGAGNIGAEAIRLVDLQLGFVTQEQSL